MDTALTPAGFRPIQYNSLQTNAILSLNCQYHPCMDFAELTQKTISGFTIPSLFHLLEKQELRRDAVWYIQGGLSSARPSPHPLISSKCRWEGCLKIRPCVRLILSFTLPLWNVNFTSLRHWAPPHLPVLADRYPCDPEQTVSGCVSEL